MSTTPSSLVELAKVAQIEMADLAAFTEADFDELTTGLGIPVGARLKLRTQWREIDKAGPEKAENPIVVPEYSATSTGIATEAVNSDDALPAGLLGNGPNPAFAGMRAKIGLVAVLLLFVVLFFIFGMSSKIDCGDHGTVSADGSACACDAGYYGRLCVSIPNNFSASYLISGSSGNSRGGNLDGTYSIVEAHCTGGWDCDAGSPTTCGGAPLYQRGGAEGPVLYRINDAYDHTGWYVADSDALADCGGGAGYASRELNRGHQPGPPNDGTAYGAWTEEGVWPRPPLMAIHTLDYAVDTCVQHGTWEGSACACRDNFIGALCDTECGCGEHGTQTGIAAAQEVGACSAGSCSCKDNFIGTLCDRSCGAHGNPSADGMTCICSDGRYSGEQCEVYDPCFGVECGSHGSCSGGRCDCDSGYSGEQCQIHDQCYGVRCGSHGSCSGGSCVCRDNFIGALCDTECGCNGHGTQTNIASARYANACSAGSCSCTDNFIGAMCDQSCGEHGTASDDGSACVWDDPTFAVSSGTCTVTQGGTCFRSANYPHGYGTNEDCTIVIAGAGLVRSTHFYTADIFPHGGALCLVEATGDRSCAVGDALRRGNTLASSGWNANNGDSFTWHSGAFDGFNGHEGGMGFEVCSLAGLASICTQHGSWDGSACGSCRDNFIGALCDQSCGEHGTASADGSACICSEGFRGMFCTDAWPYAQQYVISGSIGDHNIDGTYSLVQAHCSDPWGSNTDRPRGHCDVASRSTCGNAPVYQKDGVDGDVLFRSRSRCFDPVGWTAGCDSEDPYSPGEWHVTVSSALATCETGDGFVSAHRDANFGPYPGGRHPPGAPDNSAAYGTWKEYRSPRSIESPLTITAVPIATGSGR